ncbi:NADH-quinone oxidoreductase subunit NuoK [Helicobacter sp. MIT 14-3879]|uniref:NADH-quinone oxidoreductase subunit NuoK n=1 Tax=Helicobacter sp. MIT 14-3879 TaxID=2040649 RepID=UPI000E1F2FF5|nr:NADH-quinone oxidoreductase subunit NuoK [Helicobacter sp. MIT 14-3879]RDU63945.1 NADH-quinone oxidoreductase subunit NuoK [Helicobacter sp. MIT 14-3879]
MIVLNHYLLLSIIIFAIGIIGIMRRKNILMIFFSTEILLNAANVGLVAISKYYNDLGGQVFALFIIAIAASEVAVGLGLLIIWYRKHNNLNLDNLNKMNG